MHSFLLHQEVKGKSVLRHFFHAKHKHKRRMKITFTFSTNLLEVSSLALLGMFLRIFILKALQDNQIFLTNLSIKINHTLFITNVFCR